MLERFSTMTIRTKAEIQIHGILAGLDTRTILDLVEAEYPGTKTTKECVAWYRSHLRAAALPADHPKHDKRYVKYLVGGAVPPSSRGQAPLGSWVFVPAEVVNPDDELASWDAPTHILVE